MVEAGSSAAGTSAGVGGDSSSATPRLASSCVKVGDRTRFTVELRQGETTIVSWKRLLKDAARAEGGGGGGASSASAAAAAAPEGPVHAALEARLAPGESAANEDAPAPNRFSAVIEKIERLYMGNDSDEEDLGDVPDDDQYDTEDSFIDDAELDEYFEVEKSKTKHDGYFVNRGTLDKIEPIELANQQPKKRRRKEIAKTTGIDDDSERPIKHLKAGRKGAGKSASSAEKGMLPTSLGPMVKNSEELKLQNNKKIDTDGKPLLDVSLKMIHGDGSLSLVDTNEKSSIVPAKSSGSKLKEASGSADRVEPVHKFHSLKTDLEESQLAVPQKDKAVMRERIDLNLPDTKHTVQPLKNSVVNKKEGPSAKPKANVLEKAIRELEKIVAESRPPAPDTLDGDSSQSVKRRLPREVKQKLGKVARLAYASNGKVSKELLNRLMGIFGHLIQVRTLKRHIKLMLAMSLSAKQEKDDRFQQIKKEVVEMIKVHVSLMLQAAEQQSRGSGELHDSTHSEKGVKGQLCMDATLEDRICDLYDIFVDGLDEDATPQVRKLYAELAELWPKGVMDNHGIKRAICRAKERKRAANERNKEQEKIRRKKVVATKVEDTLHIESNSAAQSQFVDVRLVTDPNIAAVSQNRFPSTASYAAATAITPMIAAPAFNSSTSLPSLERPKHEKVKGTQNCSLTEGRSVDGMAVKKKVKKRAANLVGEAPSHTAKVASHQVNDRQKQPKHGGIPLQGVPHKSSFDEFRFEPLT